METVRRYSGVFLAAFSLTLVLTALAVAFWLDLRDDAAQRQETRLLVCQELETLKAIERDSLEEEIVDAQRFLRRNPSGIPGIPAVLIERGIARDLAAITRLAPIEGGCEEFSERASLP